MKKILFIGNSHTYMNDMPELVRQMIESATGEPCEVFMLAYSERSLKWHIEQEYFSERFNILHGGFDYCVIQEQAHPMTSEKDTEKYSARIIELCRKSGTTPVIFETWAEKRMPEHQAEMNRRYRKIARENEVLLAPIGEVWEKIKPDLEDMAKSNSDDVPDAGLYFRDGEHASPVGDYIAAMVITRTITGKLPEQSFRKSFDFRLPGDDWLPVKEGEEESVQLPEEVADVIREYVENECIDG